MSGLIWIQTAWHSDGISERMFWKGNFENNHQMTKKYAELAYMPKATIAEQSPPMKSQNFSWLYDTCSQGIHLFLYLWWYVVDNNTGFKNMVPIEAPHYDATDLTLT